MSTQLEENLFGARGGKLLDNVVHMHIHWHKALHRFQGTKQTLPFFFQYHHMQATQSAFMNLKDEFNSESDLFNEMQFSINPNVREDNISGDKG